MTGPTVLALTAHARAVGSPAREEFAAGLEHLQRRPDAVVVHTCQRVEVYLAGAAGGAEPALPAGALRLVDERAVTHLIRVVCGLDSAVLGEEQVLHQVREALARRRAQGPLDSVLHRLFETALRAGRRAHSWYPHPRRSLADVAVTQIERRAGRVRGRRLLVVGAGTMGRLAARAASGQGAEVLVCNRTPRRAAELAAAVGGRTVPWGADGALPSLRGVVLAVGGPWDVGPADLERLVGSPAVVADLSSPPALPDAVRARLAERYLSVDAFAQGLQVHLEPDLRDRLDALVSGAGGEYCRWLRARAGSATLHSLTEAAERRLQEELAWLDRRLPGLGERDRALVEQMGRRLVADLLHHPRRALHDDESGALRDAARELFALAEPTK